MPAYGLAQHAELGAPVVADEPLHGMRARPLGVGQHGARTERPDDVGVYVVHAPVLDELLEEVAKGQQLLGMDGPKGALVAWLRVGVLLAELRVKLAQAGGQARGLHGPPEPTPARYGHQSENELAGEERPEYLLLFGRPRHEDDPRRREEHRECEGHQRDAIEHHNMQQHPRQADLDPTRGRVRPLGGAAAVGAEYLQPV
mmetsp:Transcript_16811/g.48845  ORF Transcript_16811/g.48845 Transcript_16811/m.48845 type:complete len:201 (+) Transcript_16811:773-1375(+)